MDNDRSVADPEPVAGALLAVARDLMGRDLPLAISAWDGSRAGPAEPEATVSVNSPDALNHLVWSPNEVGLARAHVAGHLDFEGDVWALLALRGEPVAGRDHVAPQLRPRAWLRLVGLARRHGALARRAEIPAEEARLGGRPRGLMRARRAVTHHYDVGHDFYRVLLGPSLMYSCAYWVGPVTTLDQAQEAKAELVCRKLGLSPGQRFLDVGCGWGSLVLHAARHHGVKALGITLSDDQAAVARRRVTEAGLQGRVEIRLQDYRTLADPPFDAVASVGMFEHVPAGQVHRYLGDLTDLVRPGGRLLNHAISRPDPTENPRVKPRSFMGRYVFPDTSLHEVGTVVTAMAAEGFEVRDVQSLREHYARTLRSWLANLEENRPTVETLIGPGRTRVWRLYLAGAALAFEQNRLSVHQVLAVVPHPDGRSDMPPTRAGIEVGERSAAGERSVDLRDPVPTVSAPTPKVTAGGR